MKLNYSTSVEESPYIKTEEELKQLLQSLCIHKHEIIASTGDWNTTGSEISCACCNNVAAFLVGECITA